MGSALKSARLIYLHAQLLKSLPSLCFPLCSSPFTSFFRASTLFPEGADPASSPTSGPIPSLNSQPGFPSRDPHEPHQPLWCQRPWPQFCRVWPSVSIFVDKSRYALERGMAYAHQSTKPLILLQTFYILTSLAFVWRTAIWCLNHKWQWQQGCLFLSDLKLTWPLSPQKEQCLQSSLSQQHRKGHSGPSPPPPSIRALLGFPASSGVILPTKSSLTKLMHEDASSFRFLKHLPNGAIHSFWLLRLLLYKTVHGLPTRDPPSAHMLKFTMH